MHGTRAVIHVDMHALYASVEQLDHPRLRGRPVIVGGTGARGVVATASYEARRFGVRSAMPGATARRLCPDGVFLRPRMARYAEVSAAVFSVFAEFTPVIEGLSLDEAFLDVSASRRLLGSLPAIGALVRARVRERTGLPCSVGMAHNKLLAKLATELAKPDGLFHLPPERVGATLDPLPVERLWTIGAVAARRLAEVGVRTIGELRGADPSAVARAMGSQAATAQRLAAGIDERAVEPDRDGKSIGAECTFDQDLRTLEAAKVRLMRLVERVGERARAAGVEGRVVTLKLRVPPFETSTRRVTLVRPTAATAEVYAAGERLLARWWGESPARRLRLLGVSLSGFGGVCAAQDGLFAPQQPEDRGSDPVLDRINRRFGSGAIRRARGLSADDPE
ncbi:MAG: DNA polymerase IV [Pseudomonadota bacterium]